MLKWPILGRVRRFIQFEVDHKIFSRERVNAIEIVLFIGLTTAHRLNMAHRFEFRAVRAADHSKRSGGLQIAKYLDGFDNGYNHVGTH
jgi:hypothetical protein